MATFEVLRSVIAKEMKISEGMITPGTDLYGDLNLDSLDFHRLAMAIEDAFGVDLIEKIEESVRFPTVGRIAEMIDSMISMQEGVLALATA